MTFEQVRASGHHRARCGSDAFGGPWGSRDSDEYVLKGQKNLVANSTDADVIVVYAKLTRPRREHDPDRKVLSLYVLDKGIDGLVQGKAFYEIGMMSVPLRASCSSTMFVSDATGCSASPRETAVRATGAKAPAPTSRPSASGSRRCRWG